ncbi:MAG: phage portal protein [Chloroflexota bacterium]
MLREARLVRYQWAQDTRDRGEARALAKRYYEGDHRVELSQQMKDMLRTQTGFRNNYCELIVDGLVNRLAVRGIGADNEAATQWADDLRAANRFDALQIDVHEATICDGDSYVLVSYDEESQQVKLTYEPAWDGVEGMIGVYDYAGAELDAAVKVWLEAKRTRVNVYYRDRVMKYAIESEPIDDEQEPVGTLQLLEEMPWQVGRVPVVHFKHKSRRKNRKRFGMSHLEQVISLQDALNRTLVSMIMTSELSAFGIRIAKGFPPPAKLSPGDWLVIGEDGLGKDDVADAYLLESAEIIPFMDGANFLIDQMGTITSTPLPGLSGGDTASGESLKERKESAVSQTERAQVRFGNAWEDCMDLAAAVHNTFTSGNAIADGVRWDARWKDARPRDGQLVREHAALMRDAGYEHEFLRIMGTVLDYDEAKIEVLLEEKREQEQSAIALLGGNLPGFENFNTGGVVNGTPDPSLN